MTLLLQLPHTTEALSTTPIVTSGVESTARKRIGKKSFINKQSINKLPTIYTPEELHNLGLSFSKRQVGSKSYYRGWFNWKVAAIDSIRNELSINNLPYPADRTKFENLFFRLGVASDVGEMPSFQDAGARSGYAIEFFCRGRNLADLFIDGFNPSYNFPSFWLDELSKTPMMGGDKCSVVDGEAEQQPYHIASLGGGPAFDYVGAALATQHCSYMSSIEKQQQQQQITPAIKATILDYEEGWGDLVEAMANSTQYILQNSNLQCEWGGKCDITHSLHHPNNVATLAIAETTDMFVCQYCVAENMKQLQESNYIFFHELFKYAKDNSLFVLSEVHPRLWPDFYHLIKEHCPYMQLGFNKNGRQMLLRKRATIDDDEQEQRAEMISDKDLKLVKKYEELAFYHSRKVNSGWVRQASKRRLS